MIFIGEGVEQLPGFQQEYDLAKRIEAYWLKQGRAYNIRLECASVREPWMTKIGNRAVVRSEMVFSAVPVVPDGALLRFPDKVG